MRRRFLLSLILMCAVDRVQAAITCAGLLSGHQQLLTNVLFEGQRSSAVIDGLIQVREVARRMDGTVRNFFPTKFESTKDESRPMGMTLVGLDALSANLEASMHTVWGDLEFVRNLVSDSRSTKVDGSLLGVGYTSEFQIQTYLERLLKSTGEDSSSHWLRYAQNGIATALVWPLGVGLMARDYWTRQLPLQAFVDDIRNVMADPTKLELGRALSLRVSEQTPDSGEKFSVLLFGRLESINAPGFIAISGIKEPTKEELPQ